MAHAPTRIVAADPAAAAHRRPLDSLLRVAAFPAGLVIAAVAAFGIHSESAPTMALQVASAAITLAQPYGGLGWFPKDAPVWLQLALAAVIAEFGQYAVHRAGHRVRWMWAVHGFHHQPRRIDWLNGFRVNPLNMVWHQLAGLGVLVVLGAPESTLQMLVVLSTVVAVLQHANADLACSPWNRIFSTADLHRWHHAAAADIGPVNFGGLLVLWDQVFGTYRREPFAPAAVGIDGHPPRVPQRYLGGMFDLLRAGPGPTR